MFFLCFCREFNKTSYRNNPKQTWGQLLWNVIHYITVTFKVIALYYNDSVFEKVMNYITITSPK